MSWRLSSSAPCLSAPHRPCASHRRAQPPTPLSVAHPCEKKQGQDKCFAPLFFSCGALGGVFTRARARYRLCSYLVGARGRSLVRCARGGVAGGSAVVWDFYFTAPRPFVARLRPPELDIGAGGTDILILGRLFEMSRARQVCTHTLDISPNLACTFALLISPLISLPRQRHKTYVLYNLGKTQITWLLLFRAYRHLIPVKTAIKQNNNRFVQLSFSRSVSGCELLDNRTSLLL